ncbi:MAG: copper chaperone PCu(A)C [Chloroflexi bacterium]|nr:copper chaperone PCu(A)C [Chloroflexota bacterium]
MEFQIEEVCFAFHPDYRSHTPLSCAPSRDALTVNETWARPASKGENGAVYFVIQNDTASEDALISASTDIASTTEAHMSMLNDQGVASMQMQEAVIVPAGESVTFKPGGLHIMLVDLTENLKVGDTFMLTLQFEKAGEITVQVEVREQ